MGAHRAPSPSTATLIGTHHDTPGWLAMSTEIFRLAGAGREIKAIPVSINYDIIRLFSEGLYRSPHKAIEELVSNSYDADAQHVHVLLPEQNEDNRSHLAPLWVIDDGEGMDVPGFQQLWRIADSTKTGPSSRGRSPIGQFGIGKLAAYVLAWKLTHLSCVGGRILLATMDFRKVTRGQNETTRPVQISLREIDESTARKHAAEIKRRNPDAWALMFDEKRRASSWTAAALSDFKELYTQLSMGRLRWVMSTGLPLHTNFRIFLNGQRVTSSKEKLKTIRQIDISRTIAKIGEISGCARIYEKRLTTGKSDQHGRSNGFFVRVRGRVINLEDELFGIPQPNHAAWSRFALDVSADGLQDHLLSSREGVRESTCIEDFRECLQEVFNQCRAAFDEWNKNDAEQLDISALLSDHPSAHVTEPLLHSVRNAVESGSESFYVDLPREISVEDRLQWLTVYESQAAEKPFDRTEFVEHGPDAPALRYDPATRNLCVNSQHPFVDKLTGGGKHTDPAKLFASSEVLLEGQLQDQGVNRASIADFLSDRDRVLRLMAGYAPPTAEEVLRRLHVASVASEDPIALERAVGTAFQILGFDYQRKGGYRPGPDGVLYARLGRHKRTFADYKIVYDAKQTGHAQVPADKIDLASLEELRKQNDADFGFFIAIAYAGEKNPESKINGKIQTSAGRHLTLLKVDHLRRLAWLHFKHGITLTECRSLFANARSVPQVDRWVDDIERRLVEQGEIPLSVLLAGIEKEKEDRKAEPNIHAVRATNPALKKYEPDRLISRLHAIESIVGTRWIEVDQSGGVRLHQTADQVLVELDRNIGVLDSGGND